jgi:histidine ammonia-lyase
MEDIGTTGSIAVENLHKVVDNLCSLPSLQLLHAAQAVDLRPEFKMSDQDRKLLMKYRQRVPFVTEDRVFSTDIAEGRNFLKEWSLRDKAAC